MSRKTLFFAEEKDGSRTYLFEARQKKDGRALVRISVMKQKNGVQVEVGSLYISRGFLRTFMRRLEEIEKRIYSMRPTRPYYSPEELAELRKIFPRAYEPWNNEEDEKLRIEFIGGKNTEEIALRHGRKKGAIRARLKKIGLIEERYLAP